MRIGIDVRYLSHGLMGGVHTYIAHFVPELIELASAHEILLYADDKRPFELQDLPAHVTLRILPWHSPLSSIYHDVTLGRWMAADRLDVAHFPANYGFGPRNMRTIITLHDEINILPLREIIRGHNKHPRTIAMMTYLHACSRVALRRADLIVTVSEYSGRSIAKHSGVAPGRIRAVPHAPTPDLRRITDPVVLEDVRQRYTLPCRFVLADALKNPAVLVQAWRQLPAELRLDRTIVFFSRRPDPLPIVFDAVAAGEAILLVRPSREDLIALYSLAEVFVFPSWIEGFGIPLLEAMTCGAPIIASDRGAIPEVVGDAARIIDAEDDTALTRYLVELLSQPTVAANLRARGFARASCFSWRTSAQKMLDLYQQVMSRGVT